jgi:hypothetical protein
MLENMAQGHFKKTWYYLDLTKDLTLGHRQHHQAHLPDIGVLGDERVHQWLGVDRQHL